MTSSDFPEDGEPLRRSRTSEKDERVANENALADLCKRMVALGADKLRTLELPEEVEDAIEDARKIKSAPALARQMRRLRGFLRDLPWTTYLRKLDAKTAGIAYDEEDSTDESIYWATELPIQGDRGLGRFLERYPSGDRTRLRQLLMNVARAPEAKRTKARKQLEMLVQASIVESERQLREKERAAQARALPATLDPKRVRSPFPVDSSEEDSRDEEE